MTPEEQTKIISETLQPRILELFENKKVCAKTKEDISNLLRGFACGLEAAGIIYTGDNNDNL